jgi:glycosyltransferase involved in cell wall biosynthesis
MLGWISGLQRCGADVSLLVLSKGRTEDYSLVEPTLIPLTKWQPFDCDDDMARRAYRLIPSPLKYFRLFKALSPDIVVIRGVTPIYILLSLPITMLTSRLILYTQGRVRGGLKHNLKEAFLSRLFRGRWINPVRGSSLLPHAACNHTGRICYIPFALDVPKLALSRQWMSNSPRLLAMGKFERRKNHHVALEVLANLPKCYSLTIVGECSTDEHRKYHEHVLDVANRLQLNDRIKIITNVDHAAVSSLLSNHDIFLMLSQRESASISQLEAMAHGMPVVIGKDNGTAHYVSNAVNGFHVDYAPAEICQAVTSIVHDHGLEKMGKESMRIVTVFHNPERLGAAILEIGGARVGCA